MIHTLSEMARPHRREVAILAKQLEDPLILGDQYQRSLLAKVGLVLFCPEMHKIYLMWPI